MAATQLQPQRTARRRVSVIPRRSGPIPGATLVDQDLLASVHFSNHVLERFAERTGLPLAGRAVLEPIVKDLLLQEGLRVPSPPGWARVRKAPFYMQAGSWLLFTGRPNPRAGAGHRTITTVVARDDRIWLTALARGEIETPPPRLVKPPTLEHVRLRSSIATVLRRHGSPLTVPGEIRAAHRELQRHAERTLASHKAEWERGEHEQQAARERARERHLARHGFIA
jgi:hypothetical protein